MSEVKNEGLDVVVWRIGFPNNTGYKVYEQRQPWAYEKYGVPSVIVYEVQELCRHSEALAGYAVRDARIAELELAVKVATNEKEVAEINAEHWLNNLKKTQEVSREQRNQLRAELAAAKETIALYEVTAENCDLLRAELAAIKGQEPVAADVFQFLTAVMDAAGLVRHGRQSKELSDYLGKECARLRCSLAAPAPSAVVMPAVPDGYKLVPIEPTAAQCFTAAFNLCNEFGDEFVRDNKRFALAAYRSLVAASPSAKGGE